MEDCVPTRAPVHPLVVVGASAGGLEALTEMLSAVGSSSALSIVIVQHLAPDQKSILHSLLQSHCKLPVKQIQQDEEIRPGRVYVVPPGKLLEIEGGHLRLTDRSKDDYLFRPIDHAFESLARSFGRGAFCVVLSGTGSDGANGLRAVKEAGGIAIAQESQTARFPGMPDAAVATGLVDFVLPSAEIVDRLQEIVRHRLAFDEKRRDALQGEIESALPRIASRLRDATGHDFADYKPGTMVRRIERRMTLMRIGSVEDFIAAIETDDEEAILLAQEFLIGVTQFFRDPDAYEELRRRAIDPILDRDGAAIRIWVPGCSTGEEAYSLAILFTEAMEARNARRAIQVFGTDIDSHALRAARQGLFRAASASKLGKERLTRFFQPEGGQFQARPELREACVFAPHNVLQDPPFSRLDLISCRNLLIYLSTDLQKRIIPRFHFALKPSSFLFLGPSESVAGEDRLFDTVEKTHRIFRRNDDASPTYSALTDPVPTRQRMAGSMAVPPPTSGMPSVNQEVSAEQEFLQRRAAPFAVISEAGEVRYLSQRMTAFARPTKGAPSTQIDDFLLPELRIPVRSVLNSASEDGTERTVEGILIQEPGQDPRMFDIAVSPMRRGGNDYLLVLSEVRAIDAAALTDSIGRREASDRDLVEAENVRLRRQLSATLQEFETSGQELKSTNEELMSMNEELQSSNEELETSREELQSINEELETVNAELRENNRQLIRANSDLKNLFESTDLSVLFLDKSFAVRNFTPATTTLYGIRKRDIGRPIFDLSSRVDYPELRADALKVDETLQPIEREVRIPETDETFILRIKPYRTTDDRIDGYVLSFVDITRRKRNEGTLERNREELARQYAELETLYDTTPVGLALLDRDLRFIRINQSQADINGISIDDSIGNRAPDLIPDVADVVVPIFEKVFETGDPVLGLEVSGETPAAPGEIRHWVCDYYPVVVEDTVYAVGTCVREVTEEKRLTDELAASEGRMKSLFDASPVQIVILEGPDLVYTYTNPAHDRLTMRQVIGKPLLEAFPELEGTEIAERFRRAYEEGRRQTAPQFSVSLPFEGRDVPEERWFSQEVQPIRDGGGRVSGVVGYSFEVTDVVRARQRAEASEAEKTLLMAELQHRVKNTLATVRAISRLLLAGADSAQTFHERLVTRLGTLSRTHDLLTEANWDATALADIVAAEAGPYEREPGQRVRLAGDTVRLDAKRTLAFGMAIHELMTNAAKYGALSVEDGWIEVNAAVAPDASGPTRVTWKEHGGPAVVDPVSRKGFGSVVVEQVLASDADADVSVDYQEDGLYFEAVFRQTSTEDEHAEE